VTLPYNPFFFASSCRLVSSFILYALGFFAPAGAAVGHDRKYRAPSPLPRFGPVPSPPPSAPPPVLLLPLLLSCVSSLFLFLLPLCLFSLVPLHPQFLFSFLSLAPTRIREYRQGSLLFLFPLPIPLMLSSPLIPSLWLFPCLLLLLLRGRHGRPERRPPGKGQTLPGSPLVVFTHPYPPVETPLSLVTFFLFSSPSLYRLSSLPASYLPFPFLPFLFCLFLPSPSSFLPLLPSMARSLFRPLSAALLALGCRSGVFGEDRTGLRPVRRPIPPLHDCYPDFRGRSPNGPWHILSAIGPDRAETGGRSARPSPCSHRLQSSLSTLNNPFLILVLVSSVCAFAFSPPFFPFPLSSVCLYRYCPCKLSRYLLTLPGSAVPWV